MQELLQLLREEVRALSDSMTQALNQLSSDAESFDTTIAATEAYSLYNEQVMRMADVAEMTGLLGMQQVCLHIMANIQILSDAGQPLPASQKQYFDVWPETLCDYLENPTETASTEALVILLRSPEWPLPLTDTEAEQLSQCLQELPIEALSEEQQTRPDTVSAEDVNLQIPEHVNPQIFDSFLQEAPQQIYDITYNLDRFYKESKLQFIEAAQRAMHTLKGAAATTGIAGVLNLAHYLEDIFDHIHKHHIELDKNTQNTLVEATDCLEAMLEYLAGSGVPPDAPEVVLQKILNLVKRVDANDLHISHDHEQVTPQIEKKQPQALEEQTPLAPTSTSAETEKPTGHGEITASLHVPVSQISDLLQVSGELTVLNEQMREQLRQSHQRVKLIAKQADQITARINDLETLIDIKGVPFLEKSKTLNEQQVFDPLELDEYHELHSHTRAFSESVTDVHEHGNLLEKTLRNLESLLQEQTMLQKDLQESLLTTRMLPARSIDARLQRCVRQTCRDTNKTVQLLITGSDILLDSEVLSRVADPLMHLLRNAIDHGIEDPDTRSQLNKPETGRISIHFERTGNHMLIRCTDDGCGLDFNSIKTAALKQGLISETDNIDQQRLQRLIFRPGFSSRSSVNKTSGRGVGMDVVNQTILDLKGHLDLNSSEGIGTTIIIRIPVTLISLNLLIVKSSNRYFAIPSNMVVKSFSTGGGEIRPINTQAFYTQGNESWPVTTLDQLTHGSDGITHTSTGASKPAVLVHSEQGMTAIVVDSIVDSRENVLKHFGDYLPKVSGISGAILMGNGDIVPVLDLPELMQQSHTLDKQIQPNLRAQEILEEKTKILVVEDSLSSRRALASVARDFGYDVKTANDGLDAIKHLTEFSPDLVLTDLEMPRMNGLELTSYLRSKSEFKNLPVIMITSRQTQKHRKQAQNAGVNGYLNKPYSDSELLTKIDNALKPPTSTQENVA